jgi:hypothetical protein
MVTLAVWLIAAAVVCVAFETAEVGGLLIVAAIALLHWA